MIRLIFSDLVGNARIWLGAFLVTVAAGVVGAIAASLVTTGLSYGGRIQEILSSTTGIVIIFSSVAVLAVLSSVASLTVSLQRRGYALWLLVGVKPSLVGLVVRVQLTVVALLGSLLGVLVAIPMMQPYFDYTFTVFPELDGVRVHLDAPAAAWVIGIVSAVALLSGVRGARQASRVPAIEALRDPEPRIVRMGWMRWLLLAGLLASVVAFVTTTRGGSIDQVAGTLPLVGPLLAGMLVAVGPVLFPLVLRGWTSLVPGHASSAWFLARNSARYRLSSSTAAISPLLVGIALTGGLYTSAGTLEVAAGRDFDMPIEPVILVLGGPLLVSSIGAAVVIFMTSRAREREFALVQSAGGTHGTIVLASVWEAVIYVATASLLAAAAILATGALNALMISADSMAAPLGLASGAVVAAIGLLLVLAATVLPTVVALRHDVARTLAVQ